MSTTYTIAGTLHARDGEIGYLIVDDETGSQHALWADDPNYIDIVVAAEDLHEMPVARLHSLYMISDKIKGIVDADYFLYSRFWYGAVQPKLNWRRLCGLWREYNLIVDLLACKAEIINTRWYRYLDGPRWID